MMKIRFLYIRPCINSSKIRHLCYFSKEHTRLLGHQRNTQCHNNNIKNKSSSHTHGTNQNGCVRNGHKWRWPPPRTSWTLLVCSSQRIIVWSIRNDMTASKLSDGRRQAASFFFSLLLGLARLSLMTSAGGQRDRSCPHLGDLSDDQLPYLDLSAIIFLTSCQHKASLLLASCVHCGHALFLSIFFCIWYVIITSIKIQWNIMKVEFECNFTLCFSLFIFF